VAAFLFGRLLFRIVFHSFTPPTAFPAGRELSRPLAERPNAASRLTQIDPSPDPLPSPSPPTCQPS